MQYLMILYSTSSSSIKFKAGDIFVKVDPYDLALEVITQFVEHFQFDREDNPEEILRNLNNRILESENDYGRKICLKYDKTQYSGDLSSYPYLTKAHDGVGSDSQSNALEKRENILNWFLLNRVPDEERLEREFDIGMDGYRLKPYRLKQDDNQLLYVVTELRNGNPKDNDLLKLLYDLFSDSLKIIGDNDTVVREPSYFEGSHYQTEIRRFIETADQKMKKLYDTTNDLQQFKIDVTPISN